MKVEKSLLSPNPNPGNGYISSFLQFNHPISTRKLLSAFALIRAGDFANGVSRIRMILMNIKTMTKFTCKGDGDYLLNTVKINDNYLIFII